jgi:small-conductance mechanosensitive channel
MNYTKVMSSEGKVVYIPNKVITAENVENLTRRRYFVYTYRVPFKKTIGDPKEVKNILNIIEGKLSEYAPIEIKITSDIPNANDFVYIFTVKVPEEDNEYDREIREFLVPFIFPEA